ncbi:peptidyl-prolyl cis-trans isomerase C [Cognatiyoonia koreensis]|uniref:Parvulin-like PPIase n=1 Tax=Cognatiyoonia koreensis TaxID=364200 RepID=A0A1I0RPD8_9RHOB|nr:peptidylprolyl isomerase [Cognatiyoonia koreensis]SEW42529.1 peptidyl-prolyl cis-trans isomerase C [Cognatiyoonia koreensis]
MLKQTTLWASAACFLTFGSGAIAQDANTVVATVGDTEITLGEMIITRAQLPAQYEQFPAEIIFQGILDQLVQQQLLADSVGDEPDRVKYALVNERRALMAGETINAITTEAVTDAAVQAAYDARFDGVEPATEYNASHLLVETEEEALAAKARIDGGEEFADVARDVSTGPTGPNGGNLGWFGAGSMVPEFEAAVMALEVGAVSDPVQTQFGWHVVTLNETRLEEQPELDALRQQLSSEIQEAAIQEVLEELRAETEITLPEEGAFDPALLLNLDLLEPDAE